MITIGFTGTRKGMTDKQKAALKELLESYSPKRIYFIHGDQGVYRPGKGYIGADCEAHKIALECGCVVWIYPCNLAAQRAFCRGAKLVEEPKAPLDRNHNIVLSSDLLVAAPSSLKEELRSGTWATIRYARKTGKEVKILEP